MRIVNQVIHFLIKLWKGENMNFDTLHPADQLVMLMDRIYSYGMTTTSGGNLSILDDNGLQEV